MDVSIRFENDPNRMRIRPVVVICQNVRFTVSSKETSIRETS